MPEPIETGRSAPKKGSREVALEALRRALEVEEVSGRTVVYRATGSQERFSLTRPNGNPVPISLEEMQGVVDAVRAHPEIYEAGPGRLQQHLPYPLGYKKYSPLWAALRVMNLDELFQ